MKGILTELRKWFEVLCGEQMVLYGSHARGDAEPGSDIDVRVAQERNKGIRTKDWKILAVCGGETVEQAPETRNTVQESLANSLGPDKMLREYTFHPYEILRLRNSTEAFLYHQIEYTYEYDGALYHASLSAIVRVFVMDNDGMMWVQPLYVWDEGPDLVGNGS